MNLDLFADAPPAQRSVEPIGPGAAVLRGFALDSAGELIAGIEHVSSISPFRHLVTPGGFTMSVAMTNCGVAGWVSDRSGYRYDRLDPLTGKPWPPMPSAFWALAQSAAAAFDFGVFEPDACLINRYEPARGCRCTRIVMRRGYTDPIVSVSLGLPAVFQWGGEQS